MVSELTNQPIKQWPKRAILMCFAMSLMAITGLSIYYHNITTSIVPFTEKRLLTIARTRIEKINTHIQTKSHELDELILNDQVQKILTPSSNKAENKELNDFIAFYKEKNDFENIIFITTDGHVVFSSIENEQFAINLQQSPYKETNLGRSYEQTMLSLTTSTSAFAFDFILKKQTLYLLKPLFFQKTLKGFVAAQINPELIYEITNNYFDLRQTGEVILNELIKNQIKIITPTRNDPNATRDSVEYVEEKSKIPLERAVLGGEGSDVSKDYRNVETINSWGYIPSLSWGIIIKIDKDELVNSYAFLKYFIFIACCISLLLGILCYRIYKKRIKTWFSYIQLITNMKHSFYIYLWSILLIINFFVMGFLILSYKTLQAEIIKSAQLTAQTKTKNAVQAIDSELKNVMLRTQAVADDLATGRLIKEDISIRFERDLRENPSLFGLTIAYVPYAYDSTKKLHAISITKDNDTLEQITTTSLESLYDYTASTPDNTIHQWYHTPLATKKPLWLPLSKDIITNALIIRYAVPFYSPNDSTQPIGVIVGDYTINSVTTITQKLIIGETGYSFIIAKNGVFIYHPDAALLTHKKTIFNVAQQQTNKDLYAIGKIMTEIESGQEKYLDSTTHETVWIDFQAIPAVDWSLGTVFFEKEITLSPDIIRHMLIWILVSCVTALLFILFLLSRRLLNIQSFIKFFALGITTIFLIALACMVLIIYKTSSYHKLEGEVLISNDTELKVYRNQQESKAASYYEKITIVPTGIVLDSLTMPDINSIAITGHVWQKYDVNNKNITKEFTFADAITASIEKEFTSVENGIETIGWKINATLGQDHDYTKYPFDQQEIIITFLSKNMDSTIMLIPSLTDYRHINTQRFIGLAPEFSLSEFEVQKTFFSFINVPQISTFGLAKQESIAEKTNLQFNIVLSRKILNAFIMYLVPILIILISLFAILLGSGESIVSSTGLLFALILLHSSFRNSYRAGGILYIEYLFFLGYITILLFIIHILFLQKKKELFLYSVSVTSLIKWFFWPMQLVLWFIITAVIFYN